MKTFDEVFKNPKTITRNPKLLLQRTEDPSLTIKDAQEYLDKSAAVQVTTTHKINKKLFSKIVAYYPNQQIYMDFMNYDRFSYKKYRYIFCYVDTYSRFAVAIPMKTRNHQTLAPVLERIFEMYGVPKKIYCDNEFKGGILKRLYETNEIKMRFSHPDELHKNSIVERFNGTLAKKIQLYRTATKDNNWPHYLQDIMSNYNETVHSSTKLRPVDVFNWRRFPLPPPFPKVVPSSKTNPFLLKIGDTVRLLNKYNMFKKGDELQWSRDLYQIYKIAPGGKYKVLNLKTDEKSRKKYAIYELKKFESTFTDVGTDQEVRVERLRRKSAVVTKRELQNIHFDSKKVLLNRRERVKSMPSRYLD